MKLPEKICESLCSGQETALKCREQYGSGIKRVINSFKTNGLKAPIFENFQNGFRVTVFLKQVNVTDRKSLIISLIKKNKKISSSEIARTLKVTKRTILREMELMKDGKLIKRIGTEKGGHWEIRE